MPRLLDKIDSPADLKKFSLPALKELAEELRREIVTTVTHTGGHLASNLGVVELTIALHRIFNSPEDKIIWDVGHQSYVHKLLTGRRERFHSLRQYGGLSGYTTREESDHDPFGAGHASTSVSAALGMATVRDLAGDDYHVIAVIGDGAITAGMSFEALNHAGHLGTKIIVVYNDNGMSISPTVGALAKVMSRVRFAQRLRKAKRSGEKILAALPLGKRMYQLYKFIEARIKGSLAPTPIWEALGFSYVGPVDGHNIHELERTLNQIKENYSGPTLIHVITTKGKGYQPAESNAVYFHGVSARNNSEKTIPTYSEVFAQTVLQLARDEPKILVITPAMPEGNCLSNVEAEFPDRVFDVGICEQHAVTFAAGIATQKYIPIVAIYSTFLQRSFDQIIHDVCLQNLPVVLAIDRGGIVGDDGKTHQGTFDIAYLSLIPNLVVAAPKDENELQHLLYTAVKVGRPMAVRYPRSTGLGVRLDADFEEIPIGKSEVLKYGADVAILALGASVEPARKAAERLAAEGIEATVVNARFAKPLDSLLIKELASHIKRVVTIEENVLSGGFGSNVLKMIEDEGITDTRVKNIGLPDKFIEHGTPQQLHEKYALDDEGIYKQILALFPEHHPGDKQEITDKAKASST